MSKKSTSAAAPPQAAPSRAETSASFMSTVLKPIAIAIASSLAGIVAYVATPLNELVNGLIWRETADLVLVSQQAQPKQGQPVLVDVFLMAKSPAAISEGILTIRYPSTILRPTLDTSRALTTTIAKTSGAQRLTGKPLEFIADMVGEGEISAHLQTKTSSFEKTLSVKVVPAQEQINPNRQNFSGRWSIDLGGIHGFMELKEAARSISGSYRLNDGNGGQIEGARDGKTFRANLYRGAAPSRFSVDGTFESSETDLEIRGKAVLLIPTGDRTTPWREDKVLVFNAVGRAP